MTTMFVYILASACKSTAQSGRLGSNPEGCPPTWGILHAA